MPISISETGDLFYPMALSERNSTTTGLHQTFASDLEAIRQISQTSGIGVNCLLRGIVHDFVLKHEGNALSDPNVLSILLGALGIAERKRPQIIDLDDL